jgi:hypothetical protein
VTFDTSAVPRRVELGLGETAGFPVPSFAGGGYTWSLVPQSGAAVADVTLEVLPPSPDEAAIRREGEEPPATFLSRQRLRIDARAPGIAHWRLVLRRPFEHAAVTEVEFQVLVAEH